MGSVLCEHCTAACCRYVALPIDTPETPRDFQDMRWYVLHDRIAVFIEEGEWFIQIHTPCREILEDGRCGIYETRPPICREYTTKECDYHVGEEFNGHYFDNPEDLEVFAKEYFRKRRSRSAGKAKSNGRARSNGKAGKSSPKRRGAGIPRGLRSRRPALVQMGVAGIRK